jgi:hypothetical protein
VSCSDASAAATRPAHSGACRALYILDASDFWAELGGEQGAPALGKVSKPLARLWAKLNAHAAHLAALGPDATSLALKLLPGARPLRRLRASAGGPDVPHPPLRALAQSWRRRRRASCWPAAPPRRPPGPHAPRAR